MSAFELAAWNWHCGFVSPFTMQSGLLPALILEMGYTGKAREMFIRALNMIQLALDNIMHARARKEAEAKNG